MTNLPPAFLRSLDSLLGPSEANRLSVALTETIPPVSVRLNPDKTSVDPPFASLNDGRVAWANEGYYLKERPRFTYDPLFHAGCYYVQEASSMFIEAVYRRISEDFLPQRLLDLCAAPGGKSTLWRSLLPSGSLLVANEPVRQRAQVLAENLIKWGAPDVVVTRAFPADYAPLGGFFDVVATDVPCSGEGMFRKDEGAIEEWTPESPTACAVRGFEIVRDVWPSLREGGYLVYSTCTFNREENEDNVVRICRELGATPVVIPVSEDWNITGDLTGRDLPVYRFLPHRTRGEGLFLALLKKTSSAPLDRPKKDKRRSTKPQLPSEANRLLSWLKQPSAFELFALNEGVSAIRKELSEAITRLTAVVRPLTVGVPLAVLKGRKYAPDHGLALSVERSREAFPREEVSLEVALSYLRREALVLSPTVPRGFVLLTYRGVALGFVNHLGARANNLYPAEWRIRN